MKFKDLLDEAIEETMSIAGRRKLGQRMKRTAKKNARKRAIKAKRMATPDTMKKRAAKQARNVFKKKLSGGVPASKLTLAQRMNLDKRLKSKEGAIKKLATRSLKDVRKSERERMKKRGQVKK